MTETVETVIARAMSASKAWPVVFDAGSAQVLAAAAIAALDAAGYIITRKAPMTADEFEAWLRERHRTVGVTPALREAYDAYLAAREPSP